LRFGEKNENSYIIFCVLDLCRASLRDGFWHILPSGAWRMKCLSCRRENQLMVSEDLCLDCFQELPHEEDEIICADSYAESFESFDSPEEI
jgi:hypothetical protein